VRRSTIVENNQRLQRRFALAVRRNNALLLAASAAQALLVDAAARTLLRDATARWKNRRSTKTTRLEVVNEVKALLLGRCCCD